MGIFLRLRATHYPSLFVTVIPTARPYTRVAVVVSKKVAPRSVDRSHVKRAVYSVVRAHLDALEGFDIVVTVKTKDTQGFASDIEALFSRLQTS